MATFSGLYPATVVPFTEADTIDADALRRMIGYATSPDGVSGVVVTGHMGELLLLDREERAEVVRIARSVVSDERAVIAGIEGATLKLMTQSALDAVEAGATALLVCPPFDIRPLRPLAVHSEAVLAYFRAVADVVDVPLIVFQYNKASGCAYPLAVLEDLAAIPSVVGIKAGTRNITDYVELYDRLHDRFDILAASDGPPLLSMLLHGASGALIGVSSVGTQLWAELVTSALAGDVATAVELFHTRCLPLTAAIYENQQPTGLISAVGAAKEALVQLGVLPHNRIRQPLIGPDAHRRGLIANALSVAGLSSEAVGGHAR